MISFPVYAYKQGAMITLSSLVAPEVVVMATVDAASDGKIGIMITLVF